jgi:hypothetical protein
LSDELADALASVADPQIRSELVLGVVEKLYDTVRWVVGSAEPDELASLHRVVEQAELHRSRTYLSRSIDDSPQPIGTVGGR